MRPSALARAARGPCAHGLAPRERGVHASHGKGHARARLLLVPTSSTPVRLQPQARAAPRDHLGQRTERGSTPWRANAQRLLAEVDHVNTARAIAVRLVRPKTKIASGRTATRRRRRRRAARQPANGLATGRPSRRETVQSRATRTRRPRCAFGADEALVAARAAGDVDARSRRCNAAGRPCRCAASARSGRTRPRERPRRVRRALQRTTVSPARGQVVVLHVEPMPDGAPENCQAHIVSSPFPELDTAESTTLSQSIVRQPRIRATDETVSRCRKELKAGGAPARQRGAAPPVNPRPPASRPAEAERSSRGASEQSSTASSAAAEEPRVNAGAIAIQVEEVQSLRSKSPPTSSSSTWPTLQSVPRTGAGEDAPRSGRRCPESHWAARASKRRSRASRRTGHAQPRHREHAPPRARRARVQKVTACVGRASKARWPRCAARPPSPARR